MSIARVELPSVLILLFSVVTCAEHPMTKTSSDATTTAAEHDSVATPTKSADESQAAGETCGDVACQSSNECCKGYVCGFDPERSKVQRYCLGQ